VKEAVEVEEVEEVEEKGFLIVGLARGARFQGASQRKVRVNAGV
jgi:hypothetical protein